MNANDPGLWAFFGLSGIGYGSGGFGLRFFGSECATVNTQINTLTALISVESMYLSVLQPRNSGPPRMAAYVADSMGIHLIWINTHRGENEGTSEKISRRSIPK